MSEPARCVLSDVAGAWTAIDGDGWSIELRNDRFALAFDGRLNASYPVVACDARTFTVCASGRRQLATPHLTGDALELEVEGRGGAIGGAFVRGSDASFRFAPLDLSPKGAAPVDRAALVSELERRVAADQRVRASLPPDLDAMSKVDRDNEAWLLERTAGIGWIDPVRFGPEASRSAWLLAQHAMSLNLLAGVLAQLDPAESGSRYAAMYDRVQTRRGRPQRYGTQLFVDDEGNKGLMPIEDLGGVDDRRAELGLTPLAEYLRFFDLDEVVVLSCSDGDG